jgi:glycosyltransferase involved in cell wall biosynthesis
MLYMKIIEVCAKFYPDVGGIETHVHEIAKRIVNDGRNEVIVYTTDPTGKLPKEEIVDRILVKRFKSYAPNDAYFFSPRIYFALRKESCDVLHVHSFHSFPSLLATLALKKRGKLVFTPHYHPTASTPLRSALHLIYDPLQSSIFKKANKVICVSGMEAEMMNKRFGVPKDKIVEIPNGINVEKFRDMPPVSRSNDFQILFVGRLEKYKRASWVLLALKDMIRKYPEKRIGLVIVGKGPYEMALKSEVESLGLGEYVVFKNGLSYSQLLEEYSRCDVFVLPSEYEAFSIATLEALASKKPVIVSDAGNLPELAKGNGYVIRSAKELSQSMSLVIEKGLEVHFDSEKYSWDRIVEKTLEVYGE